MKNPIPSVWQWLGGGKNAIPGNSTATPPVPPVNAVETNHWRAFVLLWLFIPLCSLAGYLLVIAVCGSWIELKHRAMGAQQTQGPAQPPVPQQPSGDSATAPAKAEVPPTPTVHFTEGDVFTAGNGNAISRNVIINPNAHEVKSTSRETLKLAPNSSVEVVVPLGASARWETQRTVLNEWQDFDLVWHTHNRGESHPKVLRALRFTSGTEREEVRVVFTGL